MVSCSQSRIRGLVVFVCLLTLAGHPWVLEAQVCVGGNGPARHVPGPPPNHDPAAPDVDLWLPDVFRPGLVDLPNRQLPHERDSTQWDSLTTPGFHSGHEIFQSLDVLGRYAYVAYNAGFSIWNIGPDPEKPERVKVRDGWHLHPCPNDPDCGPFLSFPGTGEVDFLVEDIDVLQAPGSGTSVHIAVSGKNPVGISLWRFNTSTRRVTPVYQDTTRVSRQVRLVSVAGSSGTTVYAFSSYGNGLAVYDMNRALAIEGCLQEDSSDCPGVYLGNLGTISTGRYLDVLVRPTGEVLVAASNGNINGQGLEIWQVDPSNPGAAVRLFSGLDERTFGVALFSYEGNDYVAALERDGSFNVIKIFNVNACGGGNPCTIGAPLFVSVGVPPRSSDQFLTYSINDGSPFLYYGLFGGLSGQKVEQLLDLTTLGRGPGQNITEMTDGGPTYFDECVEEDLGYWAWYYPGNEFGLNNLTPRVGKFHPDTDFFYRAAGGVFDVHVREETLAVTTTVVNPEPDGLYWMTDEITFQGEGSNGCDPQGVWTWTPETTSEVDAFLISETGNQVTFRFDCGTTSRCSGAVARVSGANSDPSCAGAEEISAAIFMKDPRIEVLAIEPSSGTFDQCNSADFTATLVGRGPVDLDWSARRGPALDPDQELQQTFDDTVDAEDLSTAGSVFTWDTATARFAGIFQDGFESGNTDAWGQPAVLTEDFVIGVGLDGEAPSVSATVELTTCSP